MSESIHDVPLSQPLDAEEVAEFMSAVDKEDWKCLHGRFFREECTQCDDEWAVKDAQEAGESAVEDGELIITGTDLCDHGIPLTETPQFGRCSACDVKCNNTATMPPASLWRVFEDTKVKWHTMDHCWVPAVVAYSGTGAGGTTAYSYVKSTCKHFMDEFPIEDGLVIYASADTDVPLNWKREDEDKPDLGIYMYSGWLRDEIISTPGLKVPWGYQESWPMAHLVWQDYGVPDEKQWVIDAAKFMIAQAAEGKRVETGCMGGHGRTGTMLACILAVQGVEPGPAIARVRADYCKEGIENAKQAQLVGWVYDKLHGKSWRKSSVKRKAFEDEVWSGWKESKTKTTTSTPASTPTTASTPTATVTPIKKEEPTEAMGYTSDLAIYNEGWTCDHGKTLHEQCPSCLAEYGLDATDIW